MVILFTYTKTSIKSDVAIKSLYENVKVNTDVMQYNYIHQNLLVVADQIGSSEKMNSLDY